MVIDLDTLTIANAAERLRKKEFTSRALTEAVLARVRERDPEVHAYLEVFEDTALEEADAADRRLAEGDAPVLCGIPIAIKDNMLIKGRRASAASKILEKYTATYDATAIKKLKEAGAVLIGRTNLDEFAMGSSTENSAFGPTKNPHDTTRVPGGSSGGSAAAVAMGGALGAFGSDTGGSIRQPAALTGVVGFKPTYGAVSRSGLIAMGSSLDIIGPFAKSVADAKILFDAVRGRDPLDATSIETPPEMARKKSLTVGVPWKFFDKGIDEDVLAKFKEGLQKLEKAGAAIREIDFPHIAYSLAVYYIIMPAEVSTNLARFDGVKYGLHKDGVSGIDDYFESRAAGFGPETRRRIILGTYVLSSGYFDAYYNRASAVRRLITKEFADAFKEVDVIATPTTPAPAFKIGEKSDPLSMYLTDIFTVPANISGVPAISVPCGTVTRDGRALPLGFQLMAAHSHEDILFQTGGILENEA